MVDLLVNISIALFDIWFVTLPLRTDIITYISSNIQLATHALVVTR